MAVKRFAIYLLLLTGFCLSLPAVSQDARIQIDLWHALTDANRAAVERLATEFNASQSSYRIVPAYKGSYDQTMAAGLAAFDHGSPPHILQVVEVGTATMMSQSGIVKPIHELMRETRSYFDPRAYLPAITSYYSTATGEMLSFPFNSSSLVMWVNKDQLTRAGISDAPLATWPQLIAAATILQQSVSPSCGFSTAWFTWAMIEQFSAWHNLPVATRGNGIEGFDTELLIDTPLLRRHMETLVRLQRDKIFDYSGRDDAGEVRFLNGECPIFFTSSGFYGRVRENARFRFDAMPIPYYPDVKGAPQNTIIGGASLWVLRGKTPAEYRGVANFFTFLSEPNRQAELHQSLGYLPVTRAAYETTRASGFYDRIPLLQVPIRELIDRPPTENSRGLRLGDMVQLRQIWSEEFEAALRGQKSVENALSESVRRGNEVLRQFERRLL
jgi:sn-glycerol 3-phosphate transport system substrate-binding protein